MKHRLKNLLKKIRPRIKKSKHAYMSSKQQMSEKTSKQKRNNRAAKRVAQRKENSINNPGYVEFRKLEKGVHGTVIKEGNVLQTLCGEEIKNTGFYTDVKLEYPISLNAINKDHRQKHKVDIFCIDCIKMIIWAYNSKSKSFNNTESQESLLDEFLKYKRNIELEYPYYTVNYAILKDEYDPKNSKFKKYHFLNANGIPVFCTETRLKERYNIYFNNIEEKRKISTLKMLKDGIKESELTPKQVLKLLFPEQVLKRLSPEQILFQ